MSDMAGLRSKNKRIARICAMVDILPGATPAEPVDATRGVVVKLFYPGPRAWGPRPRPPRAWPSVGG